MIYQPPFEQSDWSDVTTMVELAVHASWLMSISRCMHVLYMCLCMVLSMDDCTLRRMFSSSLDVKPNEHGEYEVAKGVSASIFRAVLVREEYVIIKKEREYRTPDLLYVRSYQ